MADVITVKNDETGNEASLTYDFGADINEMINKFGAEVVFEAAKARFTSQLKGVMKRYEAAGKDLNELAAWTPGAVFRENNPVSTIMKNFEKLSPTQQELLKKQFFGSIA